jgi:hypothetical protein
MGPWRQEYGISYEQKLQTFWQTVYRILNSNCYVSTITAFAVITNIVTEQNAEVVSY